MISRLFNWLEKGSSKDQDGAGASPEEWKFETSIVDDLDEIAKLLCERFPMEITDNFWVFEHKKKVEFTTKGVSKKLVKKMIRLDSLSITHDFTETTWWKVDYEEYSRVYENKHSDYAEKLRGLSDSIKRKINNSFYWYVLCRYEDSILTVKNTMQEAIEHSGEIDDELLDKINEIIYRFAKALHERIKEEEEIECLQREAISKSLMDRLSEEIDFIDNYIETQK